MSGRFNDVQQKVNLKHPYAIYIHCMTRRINLIVIDMCKIIRYLQYNIKKKPNTYV